MRNKIFKKTLIHLGCFAVIALLPSAAFGASNSVTDGDGAKLQNPLKITSTAEVVSVFFGYLVQLGAVAVTLAIIYSGFLFVVAQGRPDQLQKARTTLFWTIIGSLVLLGAQLIAKVVQNTITGLGS